MNIANPPKRTSNTCVTCRARKVRCDGHRDTCNNCLRLGFACSYDDSASVAAAAAAVAAGAAILPNGAAMTDSLTLQAAAAHPPRRRVRIACQNCHSRKAKCSGTMPKCDRCRAHGLDCVYRPNKRSRLSTTPGAGSSQQGDTNMTDGCHAGGYGRDDRLSDHSRSLSSDRGDSRPGPLLPNHLPPPDEPLILRTFDKFFRHVHHIALFAYLHQASLMQRYHSGFMDRPLLLALIGITSLLTDLGPGTKDYGDKCIDAAESLILRDLEEPTVLKIQALIFIIKHRIFSRRFSAAFMLTGLASRFAAALGLNHENPKLCFLAQESRRRLMWGLYMLDIGIAGGHPDFTLWAGRPEAIQVKLPCNERNFEYDLPEITEMLIPPPPLPDGSLPPLPDNVGFLALHIRIQWIRSRILAFTKGLLVHRSGEVDLAMIPRKIGELQEQLDEFEARLPVSFRWSEGNVRLRTYSPRLCVYLMTHVWWRQCHCDLYRVSLVGRKDSLSAESIEALDSDFVKRCQRQCFENAKAMADMFAILLQMDKGVPVSDLDLPVCVYQCANTLYYSLATNADEFGLTSASVAATADICLKVVKQTAPGAAAAAITEGLEKLIAYGWSRPETPSSMTSPASATPANQEAIVVDPMIQRDALQDADVAHTMTNPSIPQNPPTASDGPGPGPGPGPGQIVGPDAQKAQAHTEAQPQGQSDRAEPQGQAPALLREDVAVPAAQAGMMAGVSANISNAFEGALDGSNFGLAGLEPFSMDTSSWYTGDWMDPDPPRNDGLM